MLRKLAVIKTIIIIFQFLNPLIQILTQISKIILSHWVANKTLMIYRKWTFSQKLLSVPYLNIQSLMLKYKFSIINSLLYHFIIFFASGLWIFAGVQGCIAIVKLAFDLLFYLKSDFLIFAPILYKLCHIFLSVLLSVCLYVYVCLSVCLYVYVCLSVSV